MSVTQGHKVARLAPLAAAFALASALAVGTSVPVSAAEEDFVFELPAGLACPAFDLRVEGTGDKRIMREFTDRNGNVVRLLAAGKGFTLKFTNLSTGSSLTLPSNGSVQRTTINSDGTQTVVSTGHNVVVFFPTDIPAGPSTTLYVGQIVFTIDTSGVFTLQSTSGTTTDLCALLA
jgi:autotransporter passenger strand-loop-strand repeat protein